VGKRKDAVSSTLQTTSWGKIVKRRRGHVRTTAISVERDRPARRQVEKHGKNVPYDAKRKGEKLTLKNGKNSKSSPAGGSGH